MHFFNVYGSNKNWSRKISEKVPLSEKPKKGTFTRKANTIVKNLMEVSEKDPNTALRKLQFYINRAGSKLTNKREIKKAKKKLERKIEKNNKLVTGYNIIEDIEEDEQYVNIVTINESQDPETYEELETLYDEDPINAIEFLSDWDYGDEPEFFDYIYDEDPCGFKDEVTTVYNGEGRNFKGYLLCYNCDLAYFSLYRII